MIKVIATVGTSVITNYLKPEIKVMLGNEYHCIKNAFDKLEPRDASQYYFFDAKVFIDHIENVILGKWMKGIDWDLQRGYWNTGDNILLNTAASAEISSILKIKDATEVYLIATDTILSCLAARIIASALNGFKKEDGSTLTVCFDPTVDVIEGLNFNNVQVFQEIGVPKLTERLITLGINKEKIILNITGGYKGIIPFFTILGQIYDNIEIAYLYEESNEIITVPKVPLNFDWVVQEKFYSFCITYDKIKNSSCVIREGDFIDADLRKLICKNDNLVSLTPLGHLLFDRIERSEIESRGVLGFLMEFKFMQHFSNYHYKDSEDDVFKIIEKPNKNSIYNEEEIDIILKCEEKSKFIAVEIKSYNSRKKIVQQTEKRIESFKLKNKLPSEYHIIIYSFLSDQLNANMQNLKKQFEEKIKTQIDTIPDCKARLAFLYVSWEEYKKNHNGKDQNAYVGYMGSDDSLDIRYII